MQQKFINQITKTMETNFLVKRPAGNFEKPVKANYTYLIFNTSTSESHNIVFENDKKNAFYYENNMGSEQFPMPELKKHEKIESLYIKVLIK